MRRGAAETCGVWLDTARPRARSRQTRIAAFFPARAGPAGQSRPRAPLAEAPPSGPGGAQRGQLLARPGPGPSGRRAGIPAPSRAREPENAAPAARAGAGQPPRRRRPRPGGAGAAEPLRPLTNTAAAAGPGQPGAPLTRDSEGRRAVSHRRLQAGLGAPPRKKARQDWGGGASSPSSGPDASPDLLFTEDSEGNRVIRHLICTQEQAGQDGLVFFNEQGKPSDVCALHGCLPGGCKEYASLHLVV